MLPKRVIVLWRKRYISVCRRHRNATTLYIESPLHMSRFDSQPNYMKGAVLFTLSGGA